MLAAPQAATAATGLSPLNYSYSCERYAYDKFIAEQRRAGNSDVIADVSPFSASQWRDDMAAGDCYVARKAWSKAAAVFERASKNVRSDLIPLYEHYSSSSDFALDNTEQSDLENERTILLKLAKVLSVEGERAKAAHEMLLAQNIASLLHSAGMSEADRLYAQGWPRQYSADEINVLQSRGATPSNIDSALPCHIETFDSNGKHRETWWYCDDHGNYVQAYTFENGFLKNSYTP